MSLQMKACFHSGLVFLVLLFLPDVSAQEELSLEARLDYVTGQAIFEKIWVSAPASTKASDGLGPFYNARSCAQCHQNGGKGQVENSLVLHIDDVNYGQQIQTFAISGLSAEAKVNITYSESTINLSGNEIVSLRKPDYSLSELSFGALDLLSYSPRVASSLAGLGLIEMIPQQLINDLSDEHDLNNDGISGRANWVWGDSQQEKVIGRFGWKAGQANLAQQSAKALNLDLGIGSSLYPNPYGDCTLTQQRCLEREHGNSVGQDNLEASDIMFSTLLFYVRNIPVSNRAEQENITAGKSLFRQAGCDTCHQPQFETPAGIITPYSDFLLHDMGQALADNLREAEASPVEWRTAPLWGTARSQESQVFLHDGRARSLQEAILWHGGEAENALSRYKSMAKQDRDALIRFLNSI